MPLDIVSLIVAIGTACYSIGILTARISDMKDNIRKLEEKFEKWSEYWRQQ